MYNKNLLSFCIPTYNRSDILRECLSDLIEKIKDYGFEIIVSDNGSTDDTQQVVEYFQFQYSHLKYYKQNPSIDVDVHFERVLSFAQSDYAWLLGDSYRVEKRALDEVLLILDSNKYPIVLVNAFDMIKDIDSAIYESLSKLLNDLGWYLPFMSAYIYKKNILNRFNYKKYYCSNFIQMGIVFDFFENKNFEIYWYAKNAVTITSLRKNSWQNESLKVFGKNWTEFVLSLPRSIELSVKLKCLKNHGKYHNLFTFKNLISFRERGWLTYSECKKYKIYFDYITICPWFFVVCLSVLPRGMLSLVRRTLFRKTLI